MPIVRNLAVLTAVAALSAAASSASAATVYGLTTDNLLFSSDSSTPGTVLTGTPVTGLQSNESLVGIDFRPATGTLYGVGSTSRVYTINTTTGVATAVGGPFTPALNGTSFDIDFNPTVDLFRVVSDADQNLRVSPVTGQVTSVDGSLAYTGTLTGVNPNIAGIAYSNNVGTTGGTTTLYAIDSGTDTLDIVNANAGTLTLQGALGVNATSILGFDIVTNGGVNTAYAAIQTQSSPTSKLYTINLVTGAATLVDEFGGGFIVRDIAVAVPEPTSLGLAAMGAVGLLARRRRIRRRA